MPDAQPTTGTPVRFVGAIGVYSDGVYAKVILPSVATHAVHPLALDAARTRVIEAAREWRESERLHATTANLPLMAVNTRRLMGALDALTQEAGS